MVVKKPRRLLDMLFYRNRNESWEGLIVRDDQESRDSRRSEATLLNWFCLWLML